jgi:hypothetical protein
MIKTGGRWSFSVSFLERTCELSSTIIVCRFFDMDKLVKNVGSLDEETAMQKNTVAVREIV